MKKIFIILLAFNFVSCNSQNKNTDKTKEATKEITQKSETKNDTMDFKIVKTDAEWKALLSPEEYTVLRESQNKKQSFTGIFESNYNDQDTVPGVEYKYNIIAIDKYGIASKPSDSVIITIPRD